MHRFRSVAIFSILALLPALPLQAAERITGFTIALSGGEHVRVELDGPRTVHVRYLDGRRADADTLVVDPRHRPQPVPGATVREDAATQRIDAPALHAVWDRTAHVLRIEDAGAHPLLSQSGLRTLRDGRLALRHAAGQAFYGIGGYDATEDASAGIVRRGTQVAEAGKQGHAGAPFVWTTSGYGVLLDSIGASFRLQDDAIAIDAHTRPLDYYVFVGTPPQVFAGLNRVSGAAPLFPKWAMGFTNSQWGIDQKELLDIVDTYRARHIPIDNFTLDFDWKAWGEDDYGEFRWNTRKFPDGPSGKLKAELDRRGMHLTGIMKPRVHVDTVEGRYATRHGLWLPGEKTADDYFSHKPVRDIDFDNPASRAWFFNDALKHAFRTGIVGWWNDEADTGGDTQFLNMQRTLYDGQRAISDLRVWSINRNFYLGAQRYAYGLWSGDIPTGFASMAAQRARMLSAIDAGEPKWGMDGGGFRDGTPSPENYARWIQFGAFTPIFRVHGDFGQKRQPWVYGPVAEQAATAAIRLRYALIPYIYAYETRARDTGVGLVQPLAFAFPHDANVRNDTSAWLFGDWLLVSPVVEAGQTAKQVYLPAGTWTDWFSGKTYEGGRRATLAVDSARWSDIPLFVRAGAIIPTQPVMDYVGQQPVTELQVDVFPAAVPSHFDYYDDDGRTYAYEHGAFYRQRLGTQRDAGGTRFSVGPVRGSYRPALRDYLARIHGSAATAVTDAGRRLQRYADAAALGQADGEGWAVGTDRFGPVTYVRVRAGVAHDVRLQP